MTGKPVFLIGFMGAGKSTLGKKLAPMLGYSFTDLDELIVQQQQAGSITALVESKGLDYFRQVESTALQSAESNRRVIATGGGTPCYFNNLAWMKLNGIVVYIELDEKSLYHRIKQTNLHQRPLLKGLDDAALQQFIHHTLQQRLPFYMQAQVVYQPLKQKPAALAAALLALI